MISLKDVLAVLGEVDRGVEDGDRRCRRWVKADDLVVDFLEHGEFSFGSVHGRGKRKQIFGYVSSAQVLPNSDCDVPKRMMDEESQATSAGHFPFVMFSHVSFTWTQNEVVARGPQVSVGFRHSMMDVTAIDAVEASVLS